MINNFRLTLIQERKSLHMQIPCVGVRCGEVRQGLLQTGIYSNSKTALYRKGHTVPEFFFRTP